MAKTHPYVSVDAGRAMELVRSFVTFLNGWLPLGGTLTINMKKCVQCVTVVMLYSSICQQFLNLVPLWKI